MGITGLKKYKYKYDLHVHTSPVSTCADFSSEETVDFYRETGYDGFALTNHFNIGVMQEYTTKNDFVAYYLNDYEKAKSYGKKSGIDVILGMEIRFPENTNDYLVYGITEDDVYRAFDYIYKDYRTFYTEFKTDRNIIIQAHPFRNSATLMALDYLDGIEVFNMHPGHNSRIGIAAKLAKENPDLLILGGTDFHHENHQGMCAVCTPKRIRNSIDMATLIHSRDYIFDVWGNKIIPNNLL